MISIVAAVAKNGVIGKKGALPWHIPEDLKHFKEITTGKTVLMGRNTYDSIIAKIGKPLPNRTNVVVSRRTDLNHGQGVLLFRTLDSALESLKDTKELIIMGGGEIYKQTIDKADKLYITEVHKEVEGDVKFPEIDKSKWTETSREDHDSFSFVEYKRE
jgi:dihydrofolate reductase